MARSSAGVFVGAGLQAHLPQLVGRPLRWPCAQVPIPPVPAQASVNSCQIEPNDRDVCPVGLLTQCLVMTQAA